MGKFYHQIKLIHLRRTGGGKEDFWNYPSHDKRNMLWRCSAKIEHFSSDSFGSKMYPGKKYIQVMQVNFSVLKLGKKIT